MCRFVCSRLTAIHMHVRRHLVLNIRPVRTVIIIIITIGTCSTWT